MLAADEVSADGDESFCAFGPEGGDDVGGARAPVEAGEDGLVDIEGVHEGGGIECESGGLAVAEGVGGEEARGAVAAQPGHDDAVAGGGEDWSYVDEAVDVVGPAVEGEEQGFRWKDLLRRSRYRGGPAWICLRGAKEALVAPDDGVGAWGEEASAKRGDRARSIAPVERLAALSR